jgi:uncharacterized protein with von Willebrand factor type A (vWA) domain
MKKLRGTLFVFALIAFVVYKIVGNIFSPDEYTDDNIFDRASIDPKLDSYGERGADNTWPPMDERAAQVAGNVMAKNYYLVIDGSGSMADEGCSNGKEKLVVAKQALNTFVDKLPSDTNVGVFAFDNRGIGERLALGKHSSSEIIQAINSIQAGGGTPLSSGIDAGTEVLTRQAKTQLGYGEYHMVVVTDGEASSNYAPDRAVKNLLAASPIVLHTIGFCINDHHSLNQPGYTIYKAANNPGDLLAGLESVLAEAPDFQVADFNQ